MILSNQDILKSIKNGDINISSFKEKNLKTGSYGFTLNPTLYLPKSVSEFNQISSKAEYEEIQINEKGYLIQPGQFLLGKTNEAVSLAPNIACILDSRTSLARIGLNVLQGSTFIQPGIQESQQILEINNISANPIRFYANTSIVKGIFIYMNSNSEDIQNTLAQYNQQTDPNL